MSFLLLLLTLLTSLLLFQLFATIPFNLITWVHVPQWLLWGGSLLLVTWLLRE